MIPLSWRIGAFVAALIALSGLILAAHHHVYMQGYEAAELKYQQQIEAQRKMYNAVADELERARNEKQIVYRR